MNTCRYIKTAIFCLFLSVNTAYAEIEFPAEFFASNNTHEIELQKAYSRLKGTQQSHLQNRIIKIMQKNHMEQGKFEDILGTYRMSSDNNITADNTEHFSTSPYQNLSQEKIFSLAKELAVTLKQDSVAVFIPNQSMIGDITVSFTSTQPGVNETVNMLRNRLPEQYNQAFSLHLMNKYSDFNKVKVADVEWLGSNISIDEVRAAFPLEKIKVHYGSVFLVYQNGDKEQL